MTDDEAKKFEEECREWWQQPPWSWVLKALAGAIAVAFLGWLAGIVLGLESVASAADLAEANSKKIRSLEHRLDGIEESQQRTYDRVKSIDEYLREGGGE